MHKSISTIKKQLISIVDVEKIIPISSKNNKNIEKIYEAIKEKMEEKC